MYIVVTIVLWCGRRGKEERERGERKDEREKGQREKKEGEGRQRSVNERKGEGNREDCQGGKEYH